MKNLKTVALMLIFAAVMFASQAQAKVDVIEQYTNALMTGDVPTLEKLLAPNFWDIYPNGHIADKEHFLEDIRAKKLVINRITLTNVRETKVGETRLLTGNGEFRGTMPYPTPEGWMRYTLVVANNNGKEEIVLFQATPVVATKECEDGNCRIK